MLGAPEAGDRRTELTAIIKQVRRRWRIKLAMVGLVQWLAAAIVLLLVAAYALETFKFTPEAIVTGRITTGVLLVALAGWFVVRPQWRQVDDERVALYLEEHEPSLDSVMLSALDAHGAESRSLALTNRVIEAALERCQGIDEGRRIERQPMRKYAAVAAAVVAAAVALVLLGPGFVRHALSALFVLSRPVEAAAPYRVDVTPGDATVPKGADQTITAQLHGFDAGEAAVLMRGGPDAAFERVPLVRREDGGYEGMLFDLPGPLEYFVEAAGVRSRTFKLDVVELPYVKQLDLEYVFPAYTGLPSRTIEDGGDVAVLGGTDVRVKVTPTMAAPAGRIILDDGTSLPLASNADGTLGGGFKAAKDGFYRIEPSSSTRHRARPSMPRRTTRSTSCRTERRR
ncbi:MAG: hypothetical protein LC791_05520 [Acidobacteria bacterium]|nr:hypothetical protein [Acidobacteriota bacterium]